MMQENDKIIREVTQPVCVPLLIFIYPTYGLNPYRTEQEYWQSKVHEIF